MLRKNFKTVIITVIIMFLPIIAGLVLWQKLPDRLPTHWNFAGEVDGWSSKPFAVLVIPLILMVIHLIGIFATSADPKNQGLNTKLMGLVLWICPVLSVIVMTCTYASALGMNVNVEFVIPLFMGILFLIIGNYLPKCEQNYTVGIKLPWTLNDEQNWNKTHRLAGIVWTAGS